MYNFSGALSMRFENLITGEKGLPGYSKSTVFNIRWNHSKTQNLVQIQIFLLLLTLEVVIILGSQSIN